LEDGRYDITRGGVRLRLHLRDAERGCQRYEQRLQAFRGRCMICSMLGSTHRQDQWHSLKECRNWKTWQFFNAKQDAVARGKRRQGWIAPYVACTWCGNPQDICPVDPEPGPSKLERCRYPDIVLPCAWALFHMDNRWGQTLQQVSGQPQATYESEQAWIDWLGQECELYNMRACEAARMADWVMGQMVQEHTESDRNSRSRTFVGVS
jgi:ferredoxin